MATRLTANERAEREYQRILQTLRNELMRDLERDTQKLLNSLRNDLTKELQRAFNQNLTSSAATAPTEGFGGVSSLTRIVSSILRLTAKPRMSSSTAETTRSVDAFSEFKLSQRQSLADASGELGRGERNL